MAMTAAERQAAKRERDRERNQALGMQNITLELAATERKAIAEAAQLNGYEDQTEYLLALVYADRDKSRKEKRGTCNYPDCLCPFDKGPDNLCLQGKPNPGEI